MNLNFHHEMLFEMAKRDYLEKYSNEIFSEICPFQFCLAYFVINPDKTLRIAFKYPQETNLIIQTIPKNPKGFTPGGTAYNTDIREFKKIHIPPYNNKYYFDFIIWILDITTNRYWLAHLWTNKFCSDLRFYLSRDRKNQYSQVGSNLAESYTKTFVLGHVNLNTFRLKSSNGIKRLSRNGWIPTISLLPQPYAEMVNIIESSNDINKVNEIVCETLNKDFIENIFNRWMATSLARRREEVFLIAIKAFLIEDYITPVYILMPQIEGLITEHIRRRRVTPESQLKKRFIQFGSTVKNENFNSRMTHYLADILVDHLSNVFFKTWYPYLKNGKSFAIPNLAPQRNVTMHGAINMKYFTKENCLKLMCIIDSIILLSLRKSELSFPKK
jgi:hypothetical protein